MEEDLFGGEENEEVISIEEEKEKPKIVFIENEKTPLIPTQVSSINAEYQDIPLSSTKKKKLKIRKNLLFCFGVTSFVLFTLICLVVFLAVATGIFVGVIQLILTNAHYQCCYYGENIKDHVETCEIFRSKCGEGEGGLTLLYSKNVKDCSKCVFDFTCCVYKNIDNNVCMTHMKSHKNIKCNVTHASESLTEKKKVSSCKSGEMNDCLSKKTCCVYESVKRNSDGEEIRKCYSSEDTYHVCEDSVIIQEKKYDLKKNFHVNFCDELCLVS